MDITLYDEHRAIEDGVAKSAAASATIIGPNATQTPRFPHEFHKAMADAGWLGITMPVELGGSGLGVTEAAIMMHAVTQHGGGMAAASADPHQSVRPASHRRARHRRAEEALAAAADRGREQGAVSASPNPMPASTRPASKPSRARTQRRLRHPRAARCGRRRRRSPTRFCCSTRTTPKEDCKRPTDGMTLFYTDLDRSKIEVRRIPKMGRAAVDSNAVFIDDLAVPDDGPHRRGRQGLSLSARQPQSRTHPVRRRSDRSGPRCAARAPRVRAGSASSSAGRSARTRASSIRWRRTGLDLESACWMCMRAACALRFEAALRRGSQCREVPRRPRRVRCRRRQR